MQDWDRKSIAAAAAGAMAAVGLGWLLNRAWRARDPETRPAAAFGGGKAAGFAGDTGGQRASGADAMRDPPKDWSRLDENLDETFPASDPVAVNPHVD